MSATRFSLEHFYYGQAVRDNQAAGRPALLTGSPGITPEIVTAAVEHVTLPVGQRPVIALVRGNRQLPFLLVITQRGTARQLMSHYILFPSDALRAIGGNVRFLTSLADSEMPTYSDTGAALNPLEITVPAAETDSQQVDDMLELMTATHNRMDVMESLLAAVVRNTQVVIQGAPADLQKRIDFVSGLLALLPPSVRFAVTFATHSQANSNLDVQLRFYGDETPPPNTVIYQWNEGKLTGQTVEDDYSRFVMSQLRLDTSLVIERTRALTQTAGWRMRQGDKLGDALAYGSYRLKLDTALLNNQPVDKDEIAKVLREDPTLEESLRLVYGRHLLTFSLAFDDVQHAEPLIGILGSTPELQLAAYQQMAAALENKQATTVFRMVARWLEGATLQDAEKWVDLAHRAATTRVEELVKNRSLDTLDAFVRELLLAAPAVHLERIANRLLEKILPLTPQDATLAEDSFLLAAAYMDTPRFKRLLEIKPFISQLNPQLTQLLNYLTGSETRNSPANLLMNVANQFGEQWQPLVLMRFAEMARQTGRFDMLDEGTLRGVAQLAVSPAAVEHDDRLMLVSERPSESELNLLGAKAARYLLHIRLALRDYAELAAQMIQQSTTFYRGDLQIDYIKMVEQVFATTAVPPAHIAAAVNTIGQNGIKSAPLIMASLGALQNRPASPELDIIADDIAEALTDDPRLLSVIPAESILKLLNYHVQNNDMASAISVASLVSAAAATSTEGGTKVTGQMYKLMASNRSTRPAAMQILHVYIRQADDKTARQALAYYGRELGSEVRAALNATYAVRQLTNGRDLATYAQAVHRTVNFLQDAAAAYEERNTPTIDELTMKLNGMRDTLLREERLVFTRALMGMMKGIAALYQQRSRKSPNLAQLLNGSADPVSNLDALRVIAGYFADGKRTDLNLRASLPNPLGDRTRKFLRDEILAGNEVIAGIQRLIAPDTPAEIKAARLREAVASLKADLDEAAQREVSRTLAVDLQKLASLIELIAEKSDLKVLDDDGLGGRIDDGRQRPRTALEFMRFIYGYHLTRG